MHPSRALITNRDLAPDILMLPHLRVLLKRAPEREQAARHFSNQVKLTGTGKQALGPYCTAIPRASSKSPVRSNRFIKFRR